MAAISGTQRRIFLVDDHPLIRERLCDLLEDQDEFTVCGQAANPRQAMEQIARLKPHLVITDLSMRMGDGLDLIKDLRIFHPEILILVLSMHDDPLCVQRSLRAGANGYLTKEDATTGILEAVRKVLKGDLFLTPPMARQLVHSSLTAPKGVGSLSDREMQVFQRYGLGHSVREISNDLGIGIKTVETHRQRIGEKLGLNGAQQVQRQAVIWITESRMAIH